MNPISELSTSMGSLGCPEPASLRPIVKAAAVADTVPMIARLTERSPATPSTTDDGPASTSSAAVVPSIGGEVWGRLYQRGMHAKSARLAQCEEARLRRAADSLDPNDQSLPSRLSTLVSSLPPREQVKVRVHADRMVDGLLHRRRVHQATALRCELPRPVWSLPPSRQAVSPRPPAPSQVPLARPVARTTDSRTSADLYIASLGALIASLAVAPLQPSHLPPLAQASETLSRLVAQLTTHSQ